jgi:hypothetical protein
MRAASFVAWVTLAVVGAGAAEACATKQPTRTTYFDRSIAPVLQSSCVRTNTGAGCHVADAKGNAFGNLDVSTFAGVDKRRDLLLDYGPYGQPSLLVKNVPPYQVAVQLWDGTKVNVTTDIKHTGGSILDPTASAYQTLRRWIENGATEDNTGVTPVTIPKTNCSSTIPSAPGFDPSKDPAAPDFATFKQTVEPVFSQSCVAGNCHGTTTNALYLTCGTADDQIRWNYYAASAYASVTAEQAEIVRRPLATSQGGSYHEGGALFSSVMDSGYQTLLQWVMAHGAPQPQEPQDSDPAFLFFAQRVQPVLVKKGCTMVQCHSAAMFHEYRLRGGSAGSFSLNTSRRNYDASILQLSIESDDVNASRIVRKNLYRPEVASGSTGLTHRGGPLFEDFGSMLATGTLCDQVKYDYDKGNLDMIPAYCVVREWHRRERLERKPAALSGIVYVSRPPAGAPNKDRPQDFDLFAGGASLNIVKASLTPTGDVTLMGAPAAVNLGSCGLGAGPDVRHPAVSWDAKTIAFAARSTGNDPFAIYTMNADGTGCAKQADIAAHDPSGNGLLEHDFDPVFSPPGPDGTERIVFASTRGNLPDAPSAPNFDYSGPQRTPEDPSKPNADLYVWDASSGTTHHVRQLTFQLDLERLPSFMSDGRIVFTAEKREPQFYQLALRRQNLDSGDYHPLYAQRASIGYTQATGVVELADKDFATIFSNGDAVHGAGAVAVFNRSIGIDFSSPQGSDYLIDPTVIDPNSSTSPESDFFLHSLHVVATDGSYTSPAALPDGKMLVSWGSGAPNAFGGDYDVYVLDPATGQKNKLVGNSGTAEVDAAAIYERVPKGIFTSTPDEPNGHTTVDPTQAAADVTVLDMRVLGSLLFQNTPTGRPVEKDLGGFEVYEELPPDVMSVKSMSDCGNNAATDPYGQVCVNRRLLGHLTLLGDGSVHFKIPGGVPIVLHLDDDGTSKQDKLIRWQREAMTFVPGEYTHQGFPGIFFNNLCGTCHGSISGMPVDAALKPDFLTQASQVDAISTNTSGLGSNDLSGPPKGRGPVLGPPANP